MEQRIEKKFPFLPGDKKKIDIFKIQGFFKKLYTNRRVNSIYYDTFDLNCLWDNINGFSNRDNIELDGITLLIIQKFFLKRKLKLIK